jgi:hypothetical protein
MGKRKKGRKRRKIQAKAKENNEKRNGVYIRIN